MSETDGLSGGGSGGNESSNRDGFGQRNAQVELSEGRARQDGEQTARPRAGRGLTQEKIIAMVAEMVEREIVPRLMLAHKGLAQSAMSQSPADLDKPIATLAGEGAMLEHSDLITNGSLVERFAVMSIADDIQTLEAFVSDLIERGLNDEALYLDLLAPTARQLGAMWTADICSFTDVTIGLGKLHMLLAFLSDRAFYTSATRENDLSVLLVTPPGAQHVLGIRMVDDLFVRAGWLSQCEPSIAPDALKALIKNNHFDLFGIGISYGEQVQSARALIEIVREHSQNKHIQVMLGGSLSVQQPDLAQSLGVDHIACDGREAVALAQSIMIDHKLRL
jgi:MerR family transcriptional regulator, light-induced transcriptional regulator